MFDFTETPTVHYLNHDKTDPYSTVVYFWIKYVKYQKPITHVCLQIYNLIFELNGDGFCCYEIEDIKQDAPDLIERIAISQEVTKFVDIESIAQRLESASTARGITYSDMILPALGLGHLKSDSLWCTDLVFFLLYGAFPKKYLTPIELFNIIEELNK